MRNYSTRMRNLGPRSLFPVLIFFAVSLTGFAQTTPYRYIRIGNPKATSATPHPGFALMGGGTDLDEAFRFLCDRAGGGDFLILRASGSGDYNPYVQKLCKLNSVATLILPSRAAATDPFVAQKIREASALFIAGGDQANYINFWTNSPVLSALNDSITRGVPIGVSAVCSSSSPASTSPMANRCRPPASTSAASASTSAPPSCSSPPAKPASSAPVAAPGSLTPSTPLNY